MKLGGAIRHHSLFFVFLLLFLLVGMLDIFNSDQLAYKAICDLVSPFSGSPCPTYYDLPIWNVYLSLAILAALYNIHGEIRTSNRHLSSHKH